MNIDASERPICVAKHGNLTTADPFYSDLVKQTAITSLGQFIELIHAFKDQLKVGAGYLWQGVRHSHTFGIYFRGQNEIDHGLHPSAGRPGKAYSPDKKGISSIASVGGPTLTMDES